MLLKKKKSWSGAEYKFQIFIVCFKTNNATAFSKKKKKLKGLEETTDFLN